MDDTTAGTTEEGERPFKVAIEPLDNVQEYPFARSTTSTLARSTTVWTIPSGRYNRRTLQRRSVIPSASGRGEAEIGRTAYRTWGFEPDELQTLSSTGEASEWGIRCLDVARNSVY